MSTTDDLQMIRQGSSLFYKPEKEPKARNPSPICSVALKAILTFGAILLVSAAAGCVTYYFSHSATYGAIAGTGTLLLGFCLTTKIFLRCLCSSPRPERKEIPLLRDETPRLQSPRNVTFPPTKETFTFQDKCTLDLPFLKAFSLNPNAFLLKGFHAINAQFEGEQIPTIELLQRALLLPNPKEELVDLFVEELIRCDTQNRDQKGTEYQSIHFVRPLLKYFDRNLIKQISDKAIARNPEFTLYQIFDALRVQLQNEDGLPQDIVIKKSILLTNAVKQKLHETHPDSTVVLGLALDKGFCFYHAVAELLTHQQKQPYSLQGIGQTLLDFLTTVEKSEDNWVKRLVEEDGESKENGYPTYKEYKDHLQRLADGDKLSDTWGNHFVSGILISRIYKIQIDVVLAGFNQYKKTMEDMEKEYVDDLDQIHTQIVPIVYQEHAKCPIITLALYNRHYMPVYLLTDK